MNVAIFASAYYPHVGGVEEVCRHLANGYRRRGVNPIVITNRWPRSLPAKEVYAEIPIFRLPMRVPEGSFKAKVNFRLTLHTIRAQMLRILIDHKIDLLHVQCIGLNGYYALLAREALKLPLVVSAHGERTMDPGRAYERSRFQNRVLRDALREADYITACSRHTLADLETYYGQPLGDRAEAIPSGISLADFKSPVEYRHPNPYIFGIGRLVVQKGFDLLIDAYAASGIRTHDLLIAGEGPERQLLEGRIARHNLQERVQLLGRTDREQTASLFAGCAFFVLPSRQEPWGIVNLEAMASGKALIAACVGGVPEIVTDQETGILIPGDDVPALAKGLLHLAEDEALCARLGAAGRQHATQFDWEPLTDRYVAIYHQVLSDTRMRTMRPVHGGV